MTDTEHITRKAREIAGLYGVDFDDPHEQGILLKALKEQQEAWDDWHLNPLLVEEVRYTMKLESIMEQMRQSCGELPLAYRKIEQQWEDRYRQEVSIRIGQFREKCALAQRIASGENTDWRMVTGFNSNADILARSGQMSLFKGLLWHRRVLSNAQTREAANEGFYLPTC